MFDKMKRFINRNKLEFKMVVPFVTPRILIDDTEGLDIIKTERCLRLIRIKTNNFAFIGIKRHFIFDSPFVRKILSV